MNVDRLTRLAALLDRVQAEGRGFDMAWWKHRGDCGTVACAVGWAASDPEFQAEGLRLVGDEDDSIPQFCGWTGFEAAALFFECGMHNAEGVFSPGGYEKPYEEITPADVAARVRKLLATGETA